METALLLGIGDQYGADSMAFIIDEIAQRYAVTIDGRAKTIGAFERPLKVAFPDPIGMRTAYAMPFRDQLYYLHTLGASTAMARIALDPPWLGAAIAELASVGLRRWVKRDAGRGAVHRLTERLRRRYVSRDHFALVVRVRAGSSELRSALLGRGQADATAAGAPRSKRKCHRGYGWPSRSWTRNDSSRGSRSYG